MEFGVSPPEIFENVLAIGAIYGIDIMKLAKLLVFVLLLF